MLPFQFLVLKQLHTSQQSSKSTTETTRRSSEFNNGFCLPNDKKKMSEKYLDESGEDDIDYVEVNDLKERGLGKKRE